VQVRAAWGVVNLSRKCLDTGGINFIGEEKIWKLFFVPIIFFYGSETFFSESVEFGSNSDGRVFLMYQLRV